MADEGGSSNKPCVEGLQALCASTTAWTYQVPISQGVYNQLLRPHIEKDKALLRTICKIPNKVRIEYNSQARKMYIQVSTAAI